jgi:hypothetical protein
LVKDENGELFPRPHVLIRWKNYFSQLLNVHGVSVARQMEIYKYTAEPLVTEHIPFEAKIVVAK